MLDRKITAHETKHFLANVKNIMQESWMSFNDLADGIKPDASDKHFNRANTRNIFKNIKNGSSLTNEFLNKVSIALQQSSDQLLKQAKGHELNIAGMTFFNELRQVSLSIGKKSNIRSISALTNISEEKLKYTINKGLGKFNEFEILSLHKLGFQLTTLVPFASNEVDILSLPNNHILPPGKVWIYQRKAVSKTMAEQGISIKKLSELTRLTLQDLEERVLWSSTYNKSVNNSIPPANEWRTVLSAIGLAEKSENDLILMGRYSLTRNQHDELIKCERIFREHVKKAVPKIALKEISEKDVYNFYLSIKHQWFSHSGRFTQDTIIEAIKNIGWNKFVLFSSAFFMMFIKTLPLNAAEISAEYGINICNQQANSSANKFNKAMWLFDSNLLKLLFLPFKAIGAAATTPFPTESNLLHSLSKLPIDMVQQFVEADGQSKAIVADWRKIANLLLNPNVTGESFFNAGVKLYQEKKYAEALIELNKARNILPDNHEIVLYRGFVYYNLNQDQFATSDMRYVLKFTPNNYWALLYNGMAELRLKNHKEAIANLTKATLSRSYVPQAYSQLALVYRELKETKKEGQIYFDAGVMLYKEMKYAESLIELNKARNILPDNHEIVLYRGFVYYNLNQDQFATSDMRYVLKFTPNNYWALLYNGMAEQRLKNYKEAIVNLTKASKERPTAYAPHHHLAIAYKELKDYKNAISHCDFAIKIDPKTVVIISLREELVDLDKNSIVKSSVLVTTPPAKTPAPVAITSEAAKQKIKTTALAKRSSTKDVFEQMRKDGEETSKRLREQRDKEHKEYMAKTEAIRKQQEEDRVRHSKDANKWIEDKKKREEECRKREADHKRNIEMLRTQARIFKSEFWGYKPSSGSNFGGGSLNYSSTSTNRGLLKPTACPGLPGWNLNADGRTCSPGPNIKGLTVKGFTFR